ncbi:MAG: DUF2079 domain-containing protein [Myxococcales bacterium]|nr:DUF2079 domain-containing protein [Myxococcales bacterium]
MGLPRTLAVFTALALVLSTVLGSAVGDLGAFRYPHFIITGFALWAGLTCQERHPLGPAHLVTAASLLWCVWTSFSRHLGFGINGVDFSIFDWQVASTATGNFGYSPIYEVNHFAVHPTFLLLALVPFHALAPSPYWLLLLGALSVWAGIFPLRRILRVLMGPDTDGLFELLIILAWLDNAWTGRLLNAGFRIESLTPFLLLWFVAGWLEKKRWLVVGATVALLLVKEDLALILPAFAIAASLRDRPMRALAATVTACSVVWLWLYVAKLQPALASAGPTYLSFWADFGSTPKTIVLGVVMHPLRFAQLMITSGWWTIALPSLFLPFLSFRALAGMLPTIVMLGASSNPSMHEYWTYYPVAMVPFVLLGIIEARAKGGRWANAALVAAGIMPLFWYGYARSIAPKLDLERAVQSQLEQSNAAPRIVVQTILFPHVGYGKNVRPLLSHDDLRASEGDVFLLAPALDSWPFEFDAPAKFATRLGECGERSSDPSGLETIRITKPCDAR